MEHFAFEANKKKIVYCYIRKNASSSFKRLMISRSPYKNKRKDFQSSLKFLSQFYAAKTQQFEKFDHSIFVVRDPVDRILSVFKNKFVKKTGNIDIFESYARVTGKNPETATFSGFMTDYIGRSFFRPGRARASTKWQPSAYQLFRCHTLEMPARPHD